MRTLPGTRAAWPSPSASSTTPFVLSAATSLPTRKRCDNCSLGSGCQFAPALVGSLKQFRHTDRARFLALTLTDAHAHTLIHKFTHSLSLSPHTLSHTHGTRHTRTRTHTHARTHALTHALTHVCAAPDAQRQPHRNHPRGVGEADVATPP